MGFAVSSSFELKCRPAVAARASRAGLLALAAFALARFVPVVAVPAARRPSLPPPTAAEAKPPDKMVIDADELVYDKDKNTVTAPGSVQLFYQGRVLQADGSFTIAARSASTPKVTPR